MIVLKAMLESEKMSALKNTHSQTFCTYHIKELFILIRLVPLIFEFNLNFLRVKTPGERTGKMGPESGNLWKTEGVEGRTPLRLIGVYQRVTGVTCAERARSSAVIPMASP